ncbi:hypothetical protein [Alkalihalophilus marmarensis]|uniref:hypothetical protein n=1 Tax=Alkalihalophilus marmarensis TaxID=521377 RepID=UPI002DBFF141|nr:hypothetical protein [Alkalihalophilus marmarensis]MEC2070936.1 hypothetical protein [Alkalihalophilus marmarensis]MED1601847.1 hypothetical protein [Alkalihalophilus marmarensis]
MDIVIFEPRKEPFKTKINNKQEIEQILGGPYSEFIYKSNGEEYAAFCHKEGWRKHRDEVAAVYGTVILAAGSRRLEDEDKHFLFNNGMEIEKWEIAH